MGSASPRRKGGDPDRWASAAGAACVVHIEGHRGVGADVQRVVFGPHEERVHTIGELRRVEAEAPGVLVVDGGRGAIGAVDPEGSQPQAGAALVLNRRVDVDSAAYR